MSSVLALSYTHLVWNRRQGSACTDCCHACTRQLVNMGLKAYQQHMCVLCMCSDPDKLSLSCASDDNTAQTSFHSMMSAHFAAVEAVWVQLHRLAGKTDMLDRLYDCLTALQRQYEINREDGLYWRQAAQAGTAQLAMAGVATCASHLCPVNAVAPAFSWHMIDRQICPYALVPTLQLLQFLFGM